ncbi:hypothetical protein D5086_023752 [Populus alba]|uniref:Uncharacterized protein n=3 Tax=Populus TaxID=3689 RepID=A0ACC4BBC1_POPAL|nr:hypothetical protein NC653_029834 [Populus alba x Populus x berolinensis]TKS04576.1 hypothetical protein D5086_0000143010 [Populus alba]
MATTFLINKSSAGEAGGNYLPSRRFKAIKSVFCEETVKLWKIAGPIAFNIISHYSINLLTLYLLAVLETFTSLPFNFPFCQWHLLFWFHVGNGECIGEHLWSSFWCWSSRHVGIYLQRTCMDHLMDDDSRTPLARLHICYDPILKLLGQEDTIADLAGENPLFR